MRESDLIQNFLTTYTALNLMTLGSIIETELMNKRNSLKERTYAAFQNCTTKLFDLEYQAKTLETTYYLINTLT